MKKMDSRFRGNDDGKGGNRHPCESGNPHIKTAPFLLSLLFLFLTSLAQAAPFSFESLVHTLSQESASLNIPYVETRQLHFLDHPLTSTGIFYFKKPDSIKQEILTPTPRTIFIQGQTLRMTDAQGSHTIELNQYPNLWATATTLTALFQDQPEFLKQYYQVKVAGNSENWQVELTPKPNLNLRIQKIMITGHAARIHSMILYYANGDWIKESFSTRGQQ